MRTPVVIFLTTLLSAIMPAAQAIEPDETVLQRTAREAAGAATASRVQRNDPVAIGKLVEDINAAVRKNKQRMLSIIVINTDIAASQLEREKTETGLSYGDLYVAHSLSLATKRKFQTIVALHKSGQSWADIAKSHNVALKGSSELIKEMQRQ